MSSGQPAARRHHEHLLSKHYGDGRSAGDRVADRFVTVFGGWSYIIWQSALIVAWMILNTLILRSWAGLHHVPDPYPFILLNLGFSAQASYAAPLILMAQNRGAARDKDFATHQFEIIEEIGAVGRQGSSLTQQVHDLTSAQDAVLGRIAVQAGLLDEIHRHVSALAPKAGTFTPPATGQHAAGEES